MTERTPDMPAPFDGSNQKTSVKPNPRTVRGSDLTWFNTSGANIIRTNYDTCTGDISKIRYPWGLTREPHNRSFNLEPWDGQGYCNLFQRFDLYGLTSRCPLFSGSYVNPN